MPDLPKRIEIDATLVFSPGNEALLHYLVRELLERDFKVTVFVRHEAVFKKLLESARLGVLVKKTSWAGMLARMSRRGGRFLYFCSLPPFSEQSNSIVYFHSFDLLDSRHSPQAFESTKQFLKRRLFRAFFKAFYRKPAFFACQTSAVKEQLELNYLGISVEVIPFFEPSNQISQNDLELKEIGFDFFYPATADGHKNHTRLFDAILRVATRQPLTVAVTIPHDAVSYIEKINEVNKAVGDEAIVNLGRISRVKAINILKKSRALIFPSLKESLGLPLIEAAELGKPVLASDRPYTYAALQDAYVFDPLSADSIADAIGCAMKTQYLTPAKARVTNQVDYLISRIENLL